MARITKIEERGECFEFYFKDKHMIKWTKSVDIENTNRDKYCSVAIDDRKALSMAIVLKILQS